MITVYDDGSAVDDRRNRYMTQADAAEMLGVTPQRIYSLCKTGRVRKIVLPKTHAVYVSEEDVLAYKGSRKMGRPRKA